MNDIAIATLMTSPDALLLCWCITTKYHFHIHDLDHLKTPEPLCRVPQACAYGAKSGCLLRYMCSCIEMQFGKLVAPLLHSLHTRELALIVDAAMRHVSKC
jgi:hypothetical protein